MRQPYSTSGDRHNAGGRPHATALLSHGMTWNRDNDGALPAEFLLEPAMSARRITLRVQPPMPFGEVTMVPPPLSGRPEADMARAMAAALADIEAPTAADVYNRLRQAFPTAPLSARAAALGAIMDRLRRIV
jgi:hypothetical protein